MNIIWLPPTPPAIKKRRAAITLGFALLAIAYSVITPIFEISDELSHYPVIDYIADNGALPVQNVNRENPWDWEAAQPPLYYALAALIVAPFDRDDLETHIIDNPHAKVGIGLATDNHNFVLHDWDAQKFPWAGTPLHVHLLRFFSIALATGAVWMTFTVARLTAPEKPTVALVALALTAFNPMFIAISASVNNDNLINLLAPTTFAATLTVWRRGFTWGRVVALALLGTLAAASKLSGLIVFIPAGLVIALVVLRDRLPLTYVALAALIFVVVWGGLFGWWYARNLDLYDEPFGNDHMAETVGPREESISLPDLIREEKFSFFAAYWGWFGALNILAPQNLFNYAYGMLALAGIGWAFRIVKTRILPITKPDSPIIPIFLMLLTLAFALYGLITWTLKTPASQGRLLFPFNALISTLIAIGLVESLGRRWSILITAPLLMYAIIAGVYTIPRAFQRPETINELPESAHGVDVRYGDIELLGYEIDEAPIRPDELLDVTLYWRPLGQTDEPLSFFIQVFGPDDDFEPVEVGKLDSYPERGLLRSDTWEANQIYADRYRLELNHENATLPYEPRLRIGWRDNATDEEIPATTSAGDPIDTVVVRGGGVSNYLSGGGHREWVYGNTISMTDGTASPMPDGVMVGVSFKALRPITEDFTIFAHLIGRGPREPVGFGDGPPRRGWWPSSKWIPGDTFSDRFFIPWPESGPLRPDEYVVRFGFYRPDDFTRLLVVGPFPESEPSDSAILRCWPSICSP